MSEWVIDTCIVVTCDNITGDCNTAIALLVRLYSNGTLCLDYAGHIQSEYLRNMNPRGHAMKWWKKVSSEVGKTQLYDGRVPNACRDKLQELGFHDAVSPGSDGDLAFVGVAIASADKLLVTEDSHYSGSVQSYLQRSYGVNVLSLSKAYGY